MYQTLYNNRIQNTTNEELKIFALYADKYNAKQIVKDIPNLHIAQVHDIYSKFEDISKLSFPCVLKCNHWSGDVKIIPSVEEFHKIKDKLQRHFNHKLQSIYTNGRETHYSYIKPLLFSEEYIPNINFEYRFECIWGNPVRILVGNVPSNKRIYYTLEWKKLNIVKNNDVFYDDNVEKPTLLNDMILISKKLSQNFDYVRIDLYCVDNKIYFGEYTFTPRALKLPFYNNPDFEELLTEFYNTKQIDYKRIDEFIID